MELKQEPSDPYGGVVKTEPDVVSEQGEENDWYSIKQEPFKNDHNVLGFGDTEDNDCENTATEYLINVSKLKEELNECVVPKIECELSDFPLKNESASIQFVSTTIKKELDVPDVVDNSETKQEVSDSEYKQFKTKRELLTSYCDLPTLKSENTEYSDNFLQQYSSIYTGKPLETLKTTTNVTSKKKKLYPCLVCQKNFPSSKPRSKHIDGHFGKGFLICKFCGKFVTKIDFIQHYFIHVVKNKSRKVSLNMNDISSTHDRLIINTNEKPFKCDICSKKFNNMSNFQQHLKTIHSDEKPFKCEICSKGFKRKNDIKLHLVIHSDEKPFNCGFCSKKFKRNYELMRHLIIHSNENPYKCNICSKKFNQKSTLQNHLIVHTNEKPFKCDVCFKTFKRKSDLNLHLIKHTNEKTFKCDICFKLFKRRRDIKGHLIVHSDQKPFKCDICSKKFKRNFELRRHLKTHDIKKPFECDICFKQFNLKFGLKTHLVIHTNERPFKCDICSKKFKRKSALNLHLINHTNNDIY